MEEGASSSEAVCCGSCGGDLEKSVLMTCMHVLCRNCLPSPTSARRGSVQELLYPCPVCGPASSSSGKDTSHNGLTSSSTGPTRIASQPCTSIEELRRRSQNDSSGHHLENGDDDNNENEDEDEGDAHNDGMRREDTFSSSLTFPCPHHPQRDAEQFCSSCQQLACSKCLISLHRKCAQHLISFPEALVSQRPALNSLHSRLAQRVVDCQERLRKEQSRLEDIQELRTSLIGQITAHREALTLALVAKEQALIAEVNTALDQEKERVEERVGHSQKSAHSAEGQLCVMEAVMSVKGEPEILPLVPSLHSRLDAEAEAESSACLSSTALHLAFQANTKLAEDVSKADLGHVTRSDRADPGEAGDKKDHNDLRLTLLTSFHARTREDTCDPLLTDLLLLPSGDVIVTDRDNKCVKKFNLSGHLLTRVLIPEVPSRLALVSHGKAAVSVMSRKVLFFLSLLGTVRVLSSVRVKKHYCFLASAGQGEKGECQLLAATNMCDVIDVISESGVLLRRLFTHKPDPRGGGVSISRPLYLHAPPPSRDPGQQQQQQAVAALVVDSGRRLLFALTPEGQTAFTFKPAKDSDNSLECPLGVCSVPPTGLILLADRDKHRVLLLGRRGTYLKEVLGERDGLHKPCALYGGQAGRVALTQVDGWLKIFKVD